MMLTKLPYWLKGGLCGLGVFAVLSAVALIFGFAGFIALIIAAFCFIIGAAVASEFGY